MGYAAMVLTAVRTRRRLTDDSPLGDLCNASRVRQTTRSKSRLTRPFPCCRRRATVSGLVSL
jgi:hypothetical protein